MSAQMSFFEGNENAGSKKIAPQKTHFNPADKCFIRCKQLLPMPYSLASAVATSYLERSDDDARLAFLSLVLLGHALSQGHICVDLSLYGGTKALQEYDIYDIFPEPDTWLNWLKKQSFVEEGALEDSARLDVVNTAIDQLPLCSLYKNFLYLSKWADLECRLSQQLLNRSQQLCAADLSSFSKNPEFNWQDVATVNSLLSPLSIVVGGPGTGKTTTVAKILQAVLNQEGHEQYNIALAAPTGKAAARMAAALNEKMQQMPLDPKLLSRVPDTALTLHRLLAWSQKTRQFRYHKQHPLLLDCIVIDEVSMIDMAMFVALLEALPEQCRVILLGDPFQLSSVSAGSVLADICHDTVLQYFSVGRMTDMQDLFGSALSEAAQYIPLMDNTVFLQRSYRFSDEAGIGLLAKSVLNADEVGLNKAICEAEITLYEKSQYGSANVSSDPLLLKTYQHFLQVSSATNVAAAFVAMTEFQLLCAIKEGQYSTEYYNLAILDQYSAEAESPDDLAIAGQITIYHGMLVMMEKNHHHLGIYNGDLGLVWSKDNKLWLYFKDASGEFMPFMPSQIQGWMPAHAITVHKSQGSEYDQVAFASPSIDSPLLNKEMLYTAITRSKSHFYCLAEKDELIKAMSSPCIRVSGLRARLFDGMTS
ncbi:MAG: exodeoxyribonuclease V subunit alpha [Pseudomonadales bacterium]|nr:exodeoxyribonuclease V subunit alpha [Pseudomonadales bacterium]